MKLSTDPIRGTQDFLPKESSLRSEVTQIILDNFQQNGFMQVKTPILENLNLLLGSDGGDNLKLMFKTIKRGEKLDLSKPNLTEKDIVEEGLRYDLTVPLVRLFCNNREKLPIPFKAIQIADVFRADRPQRGRLRQFTQCDIDILGDSSINAETEILNVGLDTLFKLGLKTLVLKINSRKVLNELLLNCGFKQEEIESVCISVDKLNKIGFAGMEKELAEKGLNAKNIKNLTDALAIIIKKGTNSLSSFGISKEYINELYYLINALRIMHPSANIFYDITVVRGQSYYTGIVYEVYTDGFKGAIGGGGRYDQMINKMIGISVPAVGFSIGFEPVTMLLNEQNADFSARKKVAVFFDEDDNIVEILNFRQKLTKTYDAAIYQKPKNMKNLLTKLKNAGYKYYFYFGEQQTMKEID